ncbi:MAG: hypothetical protein ACI8QZ_003644 [Chlamydiales bacterium]|jgi:hypothetical protein
MLTTLFLSATLFTPMQDSQAARPEVQHLVEVGYRRDALDRFRALDLDVLEIEFDGAQVLATDAEIALLRKHGFETQVLVHDLAAWYAKRLEQPATALGPPSLGGFLSTAFGQGGMGGYYTLAEIESVLDEMRAAYPSLISARQSIGQTVEGRDLWMVKISDNPDVDEAEPEMRIDALHHAREPEGMQVTLWFMLSLLEGYGSDPLATYLVNEREMYFLPCVNADGYEYNRQINPGGGGLWRKNRRNNGGGAFGVDLNRNYPYSWGLDDVGSSPDPNSEVYRGSAAQSEPEIQAMVSFMDSHSFGTALSIHTYGGYWLAPWGYELSGTPDLALFDELGALATAVNGYEYGPAGGVLYIANGVTFDYDYGVHGTLAWTPEIGNSSDGFWPLQSRIVPLAEENLSGLQVTALAAGTWVRVKGLTLDEVAGDGDGFFEAGESVDISVSLRNTGRLASGVIDIQLSTPSPDAVIQVGATSSGVILAFEDGFGAVPLQLTVVPGTPAATVIPFTVTVIYDGYSQDTEGEFIVGQEVVLAAFDFDAAGDQGWSVGSPNDATTGTWERGDPRGTSAQPEDDHTPGGVLTNCWFTDQGSVGGSLGESDVDNGSTTLYSPVFDLTGHTAASIHYWRWYSNDEGGAAVDDVFQIEQSIDGGLIWTEVESVGPTGAQASGGWFEYSFPADAALPATDQIQLRFIVSDIGGGSIVEAAIDDVSVRYFEDGDCQLPSSFCIAAPNSAGPGALLSSSGTPEIGLNSFSLHMDGGVPGTSGLYFYGPNQIQAPFGDGFRCVGGATRRLYPPLMADAMGSNSRALDFGVPPLGGGGAGAVTPASTWNFQLWYRDASGPGGTGFNLSDGLSITFCP